MLKLLFIVEGKENPWKYRFFFCFFLPHISLLTLLSPWQS